MKRFLTTGLVGAMLCFSMTAQAQFYGKYEDLPTLGQTRTAAVNHNAEVRVDQRLNLVIPPDIAFKDSTGKDLTTKEIFSEKPSLLLMVFYKCAGVCTTELNSMIKTVKNMNDANVGRDFNVVVVSIDPTEGPDMAAQKKEQLLDLYARRGTDEGFKFLTGTQENIKKLADEVGFHYVRDPKTGAITHPAAMMVVSPNRRLTRYFVSQEYDAKPVLLALKDSKEDKVGQRDIIAQIICCVNVDPLTGERSLDVMKALRLAGIATLLILGTSIVVMNRKNNKHETAAEPSAASEDGQE